MAESGRDFAGVKRMKRSVSDPKLQKLFADYNKRYFGGRLPRETVVRWSRKVASECLEGQCFGYPRWEILLRPGLKRDEEELRGTLLHEMVHLLEDVEDPLTLTDGGHGTWFKRQMRRLERQGALKIRVIKYGVSDTPFGKVTERHQYVCY